MPTYAFRLALPSGANTPESPKCGSEWDVVIDATSGDFVVGFSDR